MNGKMIIFDAIDLGNQSSCDLRDFLSHDKLYCEESFNLFLRFYKLIQIRVIPFFK